MSAKFTIPTTVEISYRNVIDLLQTGFDGGISYWAEIASTVEPEADDLWQGSESDAGSILPYVVSKGGAIFIRDIEDDNTPLHTLDLAAIERGLATMAREAPWHFADFVAESTDSTTGDVFIQCCLFGEILYG